MRSRRILGWMALLVAAAGAEVGCAPEPDLEAAPAEAFGVQIRGDTLRVAGSPPAVLPLGLGSPLDSQRLAELDIDVRPDGTGLPPGSGTAAEGAPIFSARCASCHGAEGHGTPAGWPLVGRNPGDAFDFNESLEKELRRTIGNYWPYAPTLFDYTRRAMPADEPGSLTDDEVYALTAWMLWRNGLVGPEEEMNAETLPAVEMPARDRFVPDDRPRDPD